MGKFTDLTGQRFGRLLVLNRFGHIGKHISWFCQCDCGKQINIRTCSLKSGHTKSCGCLQIKFAKYLGNKTCKINLPKAQTGLHRIDGTCIECLNSTMHSNNTSGIRGVHWHNQAGKWVAKIKFKGHEYHLGVFSDIGEAAFARKCAEEKYFSNFKNQYLEEHKKK